MARPLETYRGARRNAWRESKPRRPWVPVRIAQRGETKALRYVNRFMAMPPPMYVPYRIKKPVLRFRDWGDGTMVAYTDLRRQPTVYRG